MSMILTPCLGWGQAQILPLSDMAVVLHQGLGAGLRTGFEATRRTGIGRRPENGIQGIQETDIEQMRGTGIQSLQQMPI